MLRSGRSNWGEKLGQVFGGHCGRLLKISIVFLCALAVLIGIYSARSQRLTKESESTNNKLSSVASPIPVASTSKWVIVANPDDPSWDPSTPTPSPSFSSQTLEKTNGREYACTAAQVALSAGWKTIIIGGRVNCCRRPDCYAINKSQFLRMGYKSSIVLKNLTANTPYPDVYKESFRNLAFLWVIHRGARYIFDAYVEEYQSAGISISRFEEELNRQLQTVALDESLALVEERSRGRLNMFRNPYSHFGRPDVQLLPSTPGSNIHSHSYQGGHLSYTQYMNGHTSIASKLLHEYPTYRICEVRPPSIEKFLEIDEGWWDMAAPPLVLPGDTMPPLCTRNTLFAPEVFWALPLLPDYSSGENVQLPDVAQNSSRIPPWYIRGLWSQSLLEDLGGSIRLTLSKVPTLQLNRDYFSPKDLPLSPLQNSYSTNSNQSSTSSTSGPSKLLKRWSCRSRSTFRCLTLMTKELSNSLYMSSGDLAIVDAWVKDLKSVGYSEPSMLPKRRTHTNPCLGADGLLGVSFHSALVPKYELTREEYIADRNDTIKSLVAKFEADEDIKRMEGQIQGPREKRQTERPVSLELSVAPPEENSTYEHIDWSKHLIENNSSDSSISVEEDEMSPVKLTQQPPELEPDSYFIPSSRSQPHLSSTYNPTYYKSYEELLAEPETYSQRVLPIETKPSLPNARASLQTMSLPARNVKHFRAFLQQVVAKSAQEGHAARDFPILKAMADNICPGFGPLLPYMPQNIRADTLLIIVFTNQHYDLIPTLEVLYRSTFPNMLYCGHPHESVEIFKRKYQLVEQRAFSFLPTYTKSTYECVLGAIEMNYEVKGYQVITDETLLESWNTWKLDKEQVWISTHSHEKVERSTWQKFDPSGRKLARLLEGISATWKLFTYILSGSDSVEIDRKIVVKRSIFEEDEERIEEVHGPSSAFNETEAQANLEDPVGADTNESASKENLQADETAYIQTHQFRWNVSSTSNNKSENESLKNEHNDTKPIGAVDLQVSDWDYFKIPGLPEELQFDPLSIVADNETEFTNDAQADEESEILVGDDEDEHNGTNHQMADIVDIIEDVIMDSVVMSSSPPPVPTIHEEEPPIDDSVPDEEDQSPVIDLPVDESMENTTGSGFESSSPNLYTDIMSSTTPAPIIPESSVGVPLYHVEHIEPPTPTTWHRPSETSSSTTSTPEDPQLDEPMLKNATNDENNQNGNNATVDSALDGIIHAIKAINHTELSSSTTSAPSIEINLPSTPTSAASTTTPSTTTEEIREEKQMHEIVSDVLFSSANPPKEHSQEMVNTAAPSTTSTSTTSTSTTAPSSTTTPTPPHAHHDLEGDMSNEIDILLDSLHESYYTMLSVVEDYEENNDGGGGAQNINSLGTEYSSEGDYNYIEEPPSHRISPKEFRHIRCTKVDDGHQSDLCFILRQYISTLNENNRRDVRLYYDASPIYYIPSSVIKAFYSVANVLLHHGVMDELALPLLFRGLALDDEWIHLNRTIDLSEPISDSTQYIYPFNLHKVYSDPNVKHDFCSKYLLKVLEV